MTKPKIKVRAKATSVPCHTTYAKSKGKTPYDWNRALREVTPKSKARLSRMQELACEWVTCACGNQCELIPRSEALTVGGVGMPVDAVLIDLGGSFANDVLRLELAHGCDLAYFDSCRRAAQATLRQIETRSAVLIQRVLDDMAKPSRPPL